MYPISEGSRPSIPRSESSRGRCEQGRCLQKSVKPEQLPEPRKRARMMQGWAVRNRRVTMSDTKPWVGIDVSKAILEIAVVPSLKRWGVANNREGIRQSVRQIKAMKVAG